MSGQQGYPKTQGSVPPKFAWALVALGTVGLFLYFHQSKALDTPVGKPLHTPVKPNTHGVPSTQPSARQSAYHAETHSPRGLAPYVLPHLSEQERAELESVPVPRHVGTFGKTMKQAAVLDQKKHQESVDAARDEMHNEVPVHHQST